jgi:transposase
MSNEKPSEIDSLKKIISDLNAKIEQKDKEIIVLKEQVAFFKGLKFAPKSEKISSDQLGLFNEVELEDSVNDEENESEVEENDKDLILVPAHKKRRGKRRPLPESLPREVVIIDIVEKNCFKDGHELKVIGEEASEQLEIIPGRLRVIRTIRKKYSCPCCERVETAPAPPALLPKSNATPSLIAFLASSKYIDGIPLYRMEAVMKRFGIDIPRQTMARWMIEVTEKLLPLKTILREELLSSNYLHYDETPIQVLKENGREATSKSYMWVAAREGPKPIILFDYDPSRSGKVVNSLLDGFRGFLQVDGYDGYNEICSGQEIIRVGCWAHVRRYFKNAFNHKSSKKEGVQGLTFIKRP